MRVTSYKVEKFQMVPDNILTERINNTIARLNDDEPVRNGFQPYWELDQFRPMEATQEIYLTFSRWEP